MATSFCEHYLPWTNTAKEEINDACVIRDKRLIRRCPYRDNKHECKDFKPSESV